MANKKFQENHFNEAIALYTSALEHNPFNHILLANRAFCNIKLENYGTRQTPYCSCVGHNFSTSWGPLTTLLI